MEQIESNFFKPRVQQRQPTSTSGGTVGSVSRWRRRRGTASPGNKIRSRSNINIIATCFTIARFPNPLLQVFRGTLLVLQLINNVIWNYSQQANREELNQGGWQDKQWSKVEVSKFATGSSWPPPCPPTITSSHNKILGAVIKSISEEKHLSAPKDFGERLSVSILGLIKLCWNIVINHLVPTNSSKYYLYKIYTVFSLL